MIHRIEQQILRKFFNNADENLKQAIYRGIYNRISHKNRKKLQKLRQTYFKVFKTQWKFFDFLVDAYSEYPETIKAKKIVIIKSVNFEYKLASWFVPIFIRKTKLKDFKVI
jgi:hypothetical protein